MADYLINNVVTMKSRNKPALLSIIIVIAFLMPISSCNQKIKAEKIGAEFCNCVKKRVTVESKLHASKFCYNEAKHLSPYFKKYIQVVKEAKEIPNITEEEREEFRIFGMNFWVYINKNCCEEINGPYCNNRDSIPAGASNEN